MNPVAGIYLNGLGKSYMIYQITRNMATIELKYKQEHLSCGYYQKGSRSMIEILHYTKGQELNTETFDPKIVFIRKGKARVSYQKVLDLEVVSEQVILLPPLSSLYLQVEEDFSVLVVRLVPNLKLCKTYALENLYDEKRERSDKVYSLNCNDRIDRYLALLEDCVNDGIRCSNFFKIKIQELMYYLRIYYTKKELTHFFSPILTSDSIFAGFVYQNYKSARTVQDLSSLYGYSQSSFEKQFKKVFGVSAYQWMVDKKSKEIYHQLTCSDKSFTDIAVEYEFSSPSQFCDFCKHFLGASPKEIRQKRLCEI